MTRNTGASAITNLVEFAHVAGRTVVTRARSASPLKLLAPKNSGPGAWAFTSTYGGGLVSGDRIRLDVRAAPNSLCFLGTQASTKVYRSAEASVGCEQTLNASIGAGAVLVASPDPVVCFAGASYLQRQRFDLDAGAALILVDWFTSGRGACGERWKFCRYESRSDVYYAGRLVLRDALLLDQADGSIGALHRAGRFDCFATVVMIGDRIREMGSKSVAAVAAVPIHGAGQRSSFSGGVTFSASMLATGRGFVMRVAGSGVETVGRWLREQLRIVPELFGDDPWRRKF